MKTLLFACFIPILFSSCWRHQNWDEFHADGLRITNEGYSELVFVDSMTGYLGGDHLDKLVWRSDTVISNNSAVLYKTLDQGKTWTSIPVNYKGNVARIAAKGDSLTLVIQDVTSDTNYLIQSADQGKTWSEIMHFPKYHFIGDFHLETFRKGKFIIGDNKAQHLISFENDRWDTITAMQADLSYFFLNGRILSFFDIPNTGLTKGYTVSEIQQQPLKQILFEKPYFIAASTKFQNALYVVAEEGNSARILKLTKDHYEVIDLGNYAKFLSQEIRVYQNRMVLLGSWKEDVGPIGVTHRFLISDDAGKTWSLENLPNPLIVYPMAMYRDKFILSYCGEGIFQKRE